MLGLRIAEEHKKCKKESHCLAYSCGEVCGTTISQGAWLRQLRELGLRPSERQEASQKVPSPHRHEAKSDRSLWFELFRWLSRHRTKSFYPGILRSRRTSATTSRAHRPNKEVAIYHPPPGSAAFACNSHRRFDRS